jgi:hypothetical protein
MTAEPGRRRFRALPSAGIDIDLDVGLLTACNKNMCRIPTAFGYTPMEAQWS